MGLQSCWLHTLEKTKAFRSIMKCIRSHRGHVLKSQNIFVLGAMTQLIRWIWDTNCSLKNKVSNFLMTFVKWEFGESYNMMMMMMILQNSYQYGSHYDTSHDNVQVFVKHMSCIPLWSMHCRWICSDKSCQQYCRVLISCCNCCPHVDHGKENSKNIIFSNFKDCWSFKKHLKGSCCHPPLMG